LLCFSNHKCLPLPSSFSLRSFLLLGTGPQSLAASPIPACSCQVGSKMSGIDHTNATEARARGCRRLSPKHAFGKSCPPLVLSSQGVHSKSLFFALSIPKRRMQRSASGCRCMRLPENRAQPSMGNARLKPEDLAISRHPNRRICRIKTGAGMVSG
jgi:hypothetical protein